MLASFDVEAVERELAQALTQTTRDGRYIVIAYAFSSDRPHALRLLTTGRRFFAEIGEIYEELYPGELLSLGRELDWERATRFAKLHRGIHDDVIALNVFDSRDRSQRRVVREMISEAFPTQWYARGFLLFDICDFSTRTATEQVTLRLVLEAAIFQAREILATNQSADLSFNTIPTGDGCYIWHRRANRGSDAITLALGALTLAALARSHWSHLRLRLRTGFSIGRVATFPSRADAALSSPVMFRDAIGPAPNATARLCSGAAPGQFVVGDFRNVRPSNPDEQILHTADLVTAANAVVGDPDFAISLAPESPLKVIDKHGESHRCYNVSGQAFYKDGERRKVVAIGLTHDSTPVLNPRDFH